jgi:glycosyltransferase involved in cell wall biosynthesis
MPAVGAAGETPQVSIGIPTFNRAQTLERALRSALAQTHRKLEVVISDNASSDDTEAICRAIAAEDARVRYIRQSENVGPTANFNVLFEQASRSPYVMVLADDDWLEPDYVERCLSVLERRPGHVAVSGRGRYWQGETLLARQGLSMQLEQRRGVERVRAYCQVVGDGKGEDSTFYGVMRAEVRQLATPMANVLGGDLLVTARVVFQGQVCTLDDVHINKTVGGTSVSMASIVQALDLAAGQARLPELVIAGHMLREIGWQSAIYADMPLAARLGWGLRCALAAINSRSLAWHLTAPTAASLGSRRGGRWLWLAYDRLTRALGAGGLQGELLSQGRGVDGAPLDGS